MDLSTTEINKGQAIHTILPELELFEVWEINVRQIIIIVNGINSGTPKLQTALGRVLDELERNQKKENHLNTISNMMGTLGQAQLYTLSSRMA